MQRLSLVTILTHIHPTDLSVLPTHGPCSKYNITDTATGESHDGKVTITFEGDPLKVSYIHCCVLPLLHASLS